jgi:YesN/AraC family two-component response regulator
MTPNNTQKLSIKNMVCPRCVMVVKETLEKLGLDVNDVKLGSATVEPDDSVSAEEIDEQLKKYGFELVRGKDRQLIEQIKTALIRYVKVLETNENPKNLSDYLAEKIHRDYSSLSSSFSKSEEITIEKYLIHLKIERVKEWLSYGEFTLSEIAYKLNYSSVAYLSKQFKQITGMSVTDYKKAHDYFRKPLDGVG